MKIEVRIELDEEAVIKEIEKITENKCDKYHALAKLEIENGAHKQV